MIRPATKDDIRIIADIEAICFPAAEAADAQTLKERFDAFPENFLVAEENGQVIGFINGCTTVSPTLPDELYQHTTLHVPNGPYQTVFGLDVLPQFRRQGIAAQLMNAFISLAKSRGKAGMVLTCKDHLVPYYEKFGYRCMGVSASRHGGAKWNDMVMTFSK